MKKSEITSEILSHCYALSDALSTLSYAMEVMTYIDNHEEELRKIASNISGGIECLIDYQGKITDDIEKFFDELLKNEPTEVNQREQEERLLWVYRHMDANDKGRLDRYCDGFKLGYDFRGEGESSVVKGQGEAETP